MSFDPFDGDRVGEEGSARRDQSDACLLKGVKEWGVLANVGHRGLTKSVKGSGFGRYRPRPGH